DSRALNPSLTVQEFLAPFDDVRNVLRDQYGIETDERVEDDVLSETEAPRIGEVFQRYARQMRGWAKNDSALRHDVAEYTIVQSDRASANPRTWLLTQDRTLIHAAVEIKEAGQHPFCVSLVGLLQTLSPFVEATEEQSFADVFSKLLLEIIPPL